ncbi:DNA-directed DNA polymerase [Theileria orientalis]|uniref:DNA-directed DNA polymerase n=1 Tax=Theileria orientalis TaxID=68886 RepID=A0A976M6X2_THEOR|nr:DNA-directed DNA polymerase [Theileria orientalis]
MEDVEEFTPKDLEILPNKIVHDILQYGITYDSSVNEPNSDSTLGVSKNSKRYNLKNRKFKKEALCSMNRVASLFVLYITTVAESIAKSNKRSTVYDKDILQALRQCMFWEVETQIADSEKTELKQTPHKDEKAGIEMDVDDDLDVEPEDDTEIQDDLEMDEDVDEDLEELDVGDLEQIENKGLEPRINSEGQPTVDHV